MVGSDKQV